MSTLQFTLFFAGLLVAYALVHLRLMKFEAYLKEIAVLKLLNERLTSVASAMDRIKVDNLEEGLQTLHEDAKEMSAIAARIEQNLSGLRDEGEDGARLLVPGGQTAAERVCAVIEERLFQLGYQKPRLLTDLHNVHIEDEIEVRVECERQMMPYKGSVKTKNGAILDVDVHSVVSMFP